MNLYHIKLQVGNLSRYNVIRSSPYLSLAFRVDINGPLFTYSLGFWRKHLWLICSRAFWSHRSIVCLHGVGCRLALWKPPGVTHNQSQMGSWCVKAQVPLPSVGKCISMFYSLSQRPLTGLNPRGNLLIYFPHLFATMISLLPHSPSSPFCPV